MYLRLQLSSFADSLTCDRSCNSDLEDIKLGRNGIVIKALKMHKVVKQFIVVIALEQLLQLNFDFCLHINLNLYKLKNFEAPELIVLFHTPIEGGEPTF